VTILSIASKLLLHLLVNTNYELHRYELLYVNMGHHSSLGYVSEQELYRSKAEGKKAAYR
jgi:hypothetical protein